MADTDNLKQIPTGFDPSRGPGCVGCAGIGCLAAIVVFGLFVFTVYEIVKLILDHVRIV